MSGRERIISGEAKILNIINSDDEENELKQNYPLNKPTEQLSNFNVS